MQGLPAKGGQRFLALRPELAGLGLEAGAINLVAEQRMAEMGEVDTDLVGPSGLELAGQQGGDRLAVFPGEGFQHLPMGHGFAAALADGHFLAIMRMPVDRLIDGAAGPVRHAPDKGHVAAPHLAGAAMVGELGGERLVGAVVFRDDHQAGGVLVQPVDDAGPLHAADAGERRAAMGDQRVDQCAGFMARGGMDHEVLRLVDDDEVAVLEHDIERDILAFRLGGSGGRNVDCDRIPRIDMISGVANRGTANVHLACEDQRFQARARQVRAAHGEHTVQPPRSLVASDCHLDGDLVPAGFVIGRVRRALHV